MQVSLKFNSMPLLYKAMNKRKEIVIDFPGETLRDLVDCMRRQFGAAVDKALLDRNNDIDVEIRVVLNGAAYLVENRMDTRLKDGDTLTFLGASWG